MSGARGNRALADPYRCSSTTCSINERDRDPSDRKLMARVDFYVLAEEGSDVRYRFACRLAEKAVDQGHRVYLQTTSLAEAQRLDELLWTFSDRSFLAHELANGNSA